MPLSERPRYRYGVLLGLIGVSLVFQMAAPFEDWSRLVTTLLQGITLIVALWTSRVRQSIVRAALVVVVVTLAGSVALVVRGTGDVGADSTTLVNLLLVALAPAAVVAGVVRTLREHHGVTLDAMFGVLCIYLLLGMLFSFVYGAIQALGSDPLFVEASNPSQADFLYYSFTTLTTTGYGDLTAAAGLGRAVSITEALLGQIYLVTVVAAIVTNLRPRRAA